MHFMLAVVNTEQEILFCSRRSQLAQLARAQPRHQGAMRVPGGLPGEDLAMRVQNQTSFQDCYCFSNEKS